MAETLREQLQAAYDKAAEEVAEPAEDEKGEVEAEAPIEEEEKEAEPVEAEKAEPAGDEGEDDEEEIPDPPPALKAEIREKWKEISPELREEFIRIENASAEGFAKIKDDATFGKTLRQVISPYTPSINATGLPTEKAIENLLNADYVFRSGDQQQKAAMFSQLAKFYNLDTDQLWQELDDMDPGMKALQDEVQNLKQQLNQGRQAQQQQAVSTIQSAIDSFAADHDDFEQVRTHVVGLIQSGSAKGNSYEEILKDAYDQARWADPNIRTKILADQKKADEAERKKAEKADVAKRKQAGASVKGTPSKTSTDQPSNLSVRELLEKQFYESDQRI